MADIELVVKIPEVEYEHLTNKEKFYSLEKSKQEWLINKILNFVVDGTPLPKGHGDIIDRNKIEYMKAIHDLKWGKITASECATKIKYSAPTIIEKEQ